MRKAPKKYYAQLLETDGKMSNISSYSNLQLGLEHQRSQAKEQTRRGT